MMFHIAEEEGCQLQPQSSDLHSYSSYENQPVMQVQQVDPNVCLCNHFFFVPAQATL